MTSKKRESNRKTENYLQVGKVDSKELHKDKQSETQETDQSGEAERKTASVSVGGWGKDGRSLPTLFELKDSPGM